ncbi:hypothetical protein GWI33_017483 [Rhynchophorus ferrugineus]|uniref:Uncharacterized protein n=1 Tax=Rhynchophorus ferrugineus TaxID=354439 RepID=A0A834I1W5_RHYFE|nr:hypothetical protein GWI33_017483 [Rhynchophorus ferrugineus]
MVKLAAIILFAFACDVISAGFSYPSLHSTERPYTLPPFNPRTDKPLSYDRFRFKRSPNDWELKPDLGRDANGNTRAQVEINEHGRNHDINAGWAKNLRGPGSHRDTWHVGGSIRCVVRYLRREDKIKMRKIAFLFACFVALYATVSATWKPTEPRGGGSSGPFIPTQSTGPYNPNPRYTRFKRFVPSNQHNPSSNPAQIPHTPGWEVKPDIGRDQRGNTRAQVEVQHHGDNHDFNAGYDSNIRGPDGHRESWHAGGRIRW